MALDDKFKGMAAESINSMGAQHTRESAEPISDDHLTTGQQHKTYLVTISPEVVLRPHVLIWVLDALLKRRHMFPMVPMFGPQVVGVYRGDD